MRGKYIVKSNQCCKLISWVQWKQKPYLAAACQQSMCSCLSSAPQPRQRGTEGSTWQSIGQGPQGPGSWFVLWDGSAGWQHQITLPVCCRRKHARPKCSRGQCWLGHWHWHCPSSPHMDAELPPTHLVGGDACAKPEKLTKRGDLLQHIQHVWERHPLCGDARLFPGPVAVRAPV